MMTSCNKRKNKDSVAERSEMLSCAHLYAELDMLGLAGVRCLLVAQFEAHIADAGLLLGLHHLL